MRRALGAVALAAVREGRVHRSRAAAGPGTPDDAALLGLSRGEHPAPVVVLGATLLIVVRPGCAVAVFRPPAGPGWSPVEASAASTLRQVLVTAEMFALEADLLLLRREGPSDLPDGHALMNALQPLLGFVEIARERVNQPAESRRALDRALRAGEDALALARRIARGLGRRSRGGPGTEPPAAHSSAIAS